MKEYIESLELGGRSKNTIRAYEKDINKLYDFFSIKEYSDLDNLVVADFRRFYSSLTITPNSLNALIRNLSAFFGWLVDNGYIESNNQFFLVKFGKSKTVKVKKKKKVVLTREESKMLIESGVNKQERLMFALMLRTALRRSEVVNIKLEDINGAEVLITEEKGGEQHYTYLDKELRAMLDDYLENERDTDSEYLFYSTRGETSESGRLSTASVYNRIKARAKECGIPEEKALALSPHRLRGTAITMTAIEHGSTVAQALARHKDSATTGLYIELGDNVVRDLLLGKEEL